MTGSTLPAFSTSQPPPSAFPEPEMASTVLRLPEELRQKVELVVDASYPFEACGVMIGHNEGVAGQVVVKNVFHARNLNTERARDRFLLDPADHLAADRVARECGLDVVGFWHSHPDHPAQPSVTDLDLEIQAYCKKTEALHATLPVAGFATQLKVPIDIEEIYIPLRAMLDLRGVAEEVP